MSNAATKQKAPATAFVFTAEACQFADPTPRANGLQRMPVTVLARTGRPVNHFYWDWIVHDLEGMTHKPSVAFDYRHDPDEPIGVANQFWIKDGNLYLAGELISRTPEDQAARIMDLGPAGVPYELSIHFDPRSVKLEYLPEGATATVNGQAVNGPLTIVRQWELLRCAFCLTGVDGGTSAMFEEGGQEFALDWNQVNKPGPQPQSFESLFQADPRQAAEKRFHGNAPAKSKFEALFKQAN